MTEYALYMHQREHDNMVRQAPAFEAHGVPEEDRNFLHDAFSRLIADDIEAQSTAESVASGEIEPDSYGLLLRAHDREHFENNRWFRWSAHQSAVPTRKGRALFRELAAVTPDWQDGPPSPAKAPASLPAVGSFHG